VTFDDFAEVVVLDAEFHTGGHAGNRPTPVCLCAKELRSGRSHRIWLDGEQAVVNPLPPDALYVAYNASAEWGCYLDLGWRLPSRVCDLFFEYRCLTNGRTKDVGDGLIDALMYYGLPPMAASYKRDMRNRILEGVPFSEAERKDVLDYCYGDVERTVQLLGAMRVDIRLASALERGRYSVAVARIERNGIPVDVPLLRALQGCWSEFQEHLIEEVEREHGYGIYIKRPGGYSFSYAHFDNLLARESLLETWRRTEESGLPCLSKTYLEQMIIAYPRFEAFRVLRKTLSSLPTLDPPVGKDGRNRTSIMAFRAKTSRNQPKAKEFIMGYPAWLRSLMRAEPGHALIYIDLSSAEFGIAAGLSQDAAMMSDYLEEDPYIAFGKRMKYLPPHATRSTHGIERDRLKRVCLGVQYGMRHRTLGVQLAVGPLEAKALIDMHRRAYPDYWAFSRMTLETAAFRRELWTVLDWRLNDAHRQKRNTLLNFPMQAHGAEILRLACCLATEEGLEVVAPLHDAMLIHVRTDHVENAIFHAQSCWIRASAALLNGFELRCETDGSKVVFEYPLRYRDGRQDKFFDTALDFLNERGWEERSLTSIAT
jgi:DNA polymerase I